MSSPHLTPSPHPPAFLPHIPPHPHPHMAGGVHMSHHEGSSLQQYLLPPEHPPPEHPPPHQPPPHLTHHHHHSLIHPADATMLALPPELASAAPSNLHDTQALPLPDHVVFRHGEPQSFWHDILDAYRSNRYCDLAIRCGRDVRSDQPRIDCHRLVLGPVSHRLRNVLFQNPDVEDVFLPDFSYTQVKTFVDALYQQLSDPQSLDFDQLDRELVDFLDFSRAGYVPKKEPVNHADSPGETYIVEAMHDGHDDDPDYQEDLHEPEAEEEEEEAVEEEEEEEPPRKRTRSSRRAPAKKKNNKKSSLEIIKKQEPAKRRQRSAKVKKEDDDDDDEDYEPYNERLFNDKPIKEEVDSDSEMMEPEVNIMTESENRKKRDMESVMTSQLKKSLLVPDSLVEVNYISGDDNQYCYGNLSSLQNLQQKLRMCKKFRSLVAISKSKYDNTLLARCLAVSDSPFAQMRTQFDDAVDAYKATYGFADVDIVGCNLIGNVHGMKSIGNSLYQERLRLGTKYKKYNEEARQEILDSEEIVRAHKRSELKKLPDNVTLEDYLMVGMQKNVSAQLTFKMQPDLPFDDIDFIGTWAWSRKDQELQFNLIHMPTNDFMKAGTMCIRLLFSVWFGTNKVKECEYILNRYKKASELQTRKRAILEIGKGLRPKEKQCDECGKVFIVKDKTTLQRYHMHKRMHQVDRFQCDCKETFDNLTAKSRHMKLVHSGKQYAQCTICTFVEHVDLLPKHIEQNHKEFVCDECGFKTNSKYNHANHMKYNHTVLKCKQCGEQFLGKPKLREHKELVHPTNESFPCPECDSVFRKKNHLYNHKMTVHTPDDQKRHRCDQCPKAFHTMSHLKTHQMSIHIREFNYLCRYNCGKAFILPGNRRLHEKNIHEKGLDQATIMAAMLKD